ncbi:MAG: hypothetical protein QXP53_02370 [Candidatus Pacearchaeota archaeon]
MAKEAIKSKKQFSLIAWLVTTILILLFLSYVSYYKEEKLASKTVFQLPQQPTEQTIQQPTEESSESGAIFQLPK